MKQMNVDLCNIIILVRQRHYEELFTTIFLMVAINMYFCCHYFVHHQIPTARCSSVVEHLLIVWWVGGSIPYGGLGEIFFV